MRSPIIRVVAPLIVATVLLIIVLLPASATASTAAPAQTFTVNTRFDISIGGCTVDHCTLREAVVAANATPAHDTIIFTVDTIDFDIQLQAGQLDIVNDLTIVGGTGVVGEFTRITANSASRHFEIASGIEVKLGHLLLFNGLADNGGAILNFGILTLDQMSVADNEAVKAGNFGDGGGVYNKSSGTLHVLNDSLIWSNDANFGGGIYNAGGDVTVRNSSIYANNARGHPQSNGGGIRNSGGGNVTIDASEILLNFASAWGGGIRNVEPSQLTVEDTMITQNRALTGAGVWNNGTADIRRSYFGGNVGSVDDLVGDGAAISSEGVLKVTNSTVAFNNSAEGAIEVTGPDSDASIANSSIYNNEGTSVKVVLGATARFSHTLIGKPEGTDWDCFFGLDAQIEYGGVNVDTDGRCGAFVTITNLQLDAVDYYGGSTPVLGLLSNSPLIDAGVNAACATVDQRNAARPADGNGNGTAQCDIGAFEYGAVVPTAVQVRAHETSVDAARLWTVGVVLAGLALVSALIVARQRDLHGSV